MCETNWPGPPISAALRSQVARDYDALGETGWPERPASFLWNQYGIDLRAQYAGQEIAMPFGKASGQLSMNVGQVEEDVRAGLGFVVLKTVIAQDSAGEQTMSAWAVRDARMLVEPIRGQSGETGWTVSWKGRGWWQSFEEYLALIRGARTRAAGSGTLIVPSCKYHLPGAGETAWKVSEYEYTTQALWRAWQDAASDDSTETLPMPLEKDFSPTLAGSDRAAAREQILEWLRMTPRLIRAAVPAGGACVGLKLFNALFDDEFQLEMLRAIHAAEPDDRPDFHVYGNRLFDPQREFEGHRGIAYGGPDLSDRNRRVMARFAEECRASFRPMLPWSATGNIVTGKQAVERALLGASTFQMHTYFQLPADQYRMRVGNRSQRALHELLLHPTHGFVVWLWHAADRLGLGASPLRFSEIIGRGLLADEGPSPP